MAKQSADTTSTKPRRGAGEGGIYQRASDGKWVGAVNLGYVDGKRKRKVVYGETRRDVAEAMKKILRDQQQGLPIQTERQTVKDFLERWLEDVARHTVRIKTFESYSRQIRVHIAPALGKIALDRLTAQDIAGFYRRQLDKGLAPGTVNRQHAIMHRALTQAVRWNLIPRNPADLVDPPRPGRTEMQALTSEQAVALLEAARSTRLYALYCLAVTTGMRQSELLGLTWPDVDLAGGTLHVRRQLVWSTGKGFALTEPKTAKGRRAIALSSFVVDGLKHHRTAQLSERLAAGPLWEDHDLVFPNALGRPMERGNLVRRSFLPLLKAAGLPRIRFHDLRHTAATLMLRLGEHPKVVQERLGHSTIAVTLDVYSHVMPDMQREAADRLDVLLGGA